MLKQKQGFVLIEGLVAAALIAMFAGSIAGVYLSVNKIERQEIDDIQARLLSHGALEAVRAIRDGDSPAFSAGTYGIATTSGAFAFSGSSDTDGDFTRAVTITEATTDTFRASVVTTGGASSKTFATYFTRWREALPLLASLELDTSELDLYSQNRRIRDVFVNNVSDEDITITDIDVSWSGGTPLNTLFQVRLDNSQVWSGLEFNPASSLDISDTVVEADDDREFEFRFSLPVEGATITLTLYTDAGEYTLTFQAVE